MLFGFHHFNENRYAVPNVTEQEFLGKINFFLRLYQK